MYHIEKMGNRQLGSRLEEELMNYILREPIEVGKKIPNEFDLAEKFGVGRSTVREAVKGLVTKGILEVRRGSGTFVVSHHSLEEDPLGLTRLEDKYKLALELFELRLMLEPEIAYMAARNITEQQLDRLREMCDEMERLSAQRKERMPLDVEFHVCLAESCGNVVMPKLIPVLRQGVELFIKYTHREATPESTAKHRDILEALEAHDPQWAKDMMLMHLTYNSQEIRREAIRRGVIYDG